MSGPHGPDRTGELRSSKCTSPYLTDASPIANLVGGLSENVNHVNSTDQKTLIRSEELPASVFALPFNLEVDLMGLISSNGSVDITFDIDLVEPDGTRVTIATVTTAALANEDDKPFHLKLMGKVVTPPAYLDADIDGVPESALGKMAAVGILEVFQGTPLRFAGNSAAAGVEADFLNGTFIEVTADHDAADADSDVILLGGTIKICNLDGGA